MPSCMRFLGLVVLALVLAAGFTPDAYTQDMPFSVFDSYQGGKVWMKYTDLDNALYHHIAGLAEESLAERRNRISKLDTLREWDDHLASLKEAAFSGVMGFKRTPLNARVTGRIDRADYHVEKVVFESFPGFHVTGCIFIPAAGPGPFPAVLVAIGHSQAAFRRDLYQQNILNLVRKGFVVFTFDPAGQGERVQYPDPETGESLIGGSTSEHSYAGAQCLLAGYSVSDYFIWDGVRALDYLLSRPEVEPSRIGMTGISGGGTLTAQLSAYDKRIHAAAPECYITGYHRLFESIGPQDAEQNLYRGLVRGIDHADLLSLRAPGPTMIISVTQDFFSIQGARESFEEAKGVFAAYNRPQNLTMVEADGTHGTRKKNRESMYSFFQHHLNFPGSSDDEEVEFFSEDELTVTPGGQVSGAYGSKAIFDLNKDRAIRVMDGRRIKDPQQLLENRGLIAGKARELSGFDSSRAIRSVVYTGKLEKENYRIEKYFIQGECFDYPIPFVLVKPYGEEKKPLLLYLSPEGKQRLLDNHQEIEDYIEQGYSILAPDLIGTGELSNKAYQGDSYIEGNSFNLLFGANLVGRSIAGMQAGDLDVLQKHIQDRTDIETENITVVAMGETCSSFLHFGIFNHQVSKIILVNPLSSYRDLLMTRYYDPDLLWTAVPGAVQYYDLVHLEALLAPRELVIISPLSAEGEPADPQSIEEESLFLKAAYRLSNAEEKLTIDLEGGATENRVKKYLD